MTEAIRAGLQKRIDELAGNNLAVSFKMFGLNTFMLQVNQAQIAGVIKPEDGLTSDEAQNLRDHILKSANKLQEKGK